MNLEPPTSSVGAPSRPSWTHCGFERKLTQERATALRPPADGSPWWRSTARHRSLANVGRRHYWMCLSAAGFSSPTTSCGTPATLRRSSARGAPCIRRRSATCLIFILAMSPTPRSAKARTREPPVPQVHGLGDALVLGPGLARHSLGWPRGEHDVHRLLPATRIQCLRDLLDDEARR